MSGHSVEIRAALQQVPWIAEAGEAVIDELAAASRWVVLRKGAELIGRGQAVNHLAVIASGAIESSVPAMSGEHRPTSVMHSGQALGYNPLFLQTPAKSMHIATAPTEVVLVPREALLSLMQKNMPLMLGILGEQCRRVEQLLDLVGDQRLLSPLARVARMLLVQSRHYAPRAERASGPPQVHLSQRDLAELIGLTRQSVNAELKRLEAMGAIELRYSAITLREIASLEAIVNAES